MLGWNDIKSPSVCLAASRFCGAARTWARSGRAQRRGGRALSAARMNSPEAHSSTSGPLPPRRARPLTTDELVSGVLAGNRAILARAITLVESSARTHQAQAQELLRNLLSHSGKSRRIGITGVPGVGKSTIIESLGCYLIDQGHKVAVLTIDPSSARTGGSILGDKTRMERLSREANAFIRPSPAGENLGGVARRTRETMLICEAAGFDIVIVESVGVGQSEITLRSMVDFFLVLLLPGAGDELQGIKRGILEMADLVLVNKADGENRLRAEQARGEQDAALHYAQPATPGWRTQVNLCSGLTGEGVPQLWETVDSFYRTLSPTGQIAERRQRQLLDWMMDLIYDELRRRFDHDARVIAELPAIQQALLHGDLTAVSAAQTLLNAFDRRESPPV